MKILKNELFFFLFLIAIFVVSNTAAIIFFCFCWPANVDANLLVFGLLFAMMLLLLLPLLIFLKLLAMLLLLIFTAISNVTTANFLLLFVMLLLVMVLLSNFVCCYQCCCFLGKAVWSIVSRQHFKIGPTGWYWVFLHSIRVIHSCIPFFHSILAFHSCNLLL